ncbi:hypothetical protein PV08_03112 [Exophiala spinifera]|uniref:N-acetyltransferase domain-containing protein n=1 Tax=Exophiala spinifera TaxID=91928 RepID=A0A0D2BIR5_9EURO|nr:uncharacterized protein PV08_03112 [Exophiala spinifera]KIW18823.1 hypothetical protein PV08_03112 [Exophiala spinifera]
MAGNEIPIEFRAAKVEEDDVLSRILCNAFLPIWNHNWFHGVSEALAPVDVGQVGGPTPSMTSSQKSRVKFYRSLINVTRLIGGDVLVADIPSSDASGDAEKDVAAILLWLPPFTRLGGFDIITLWKSGFLGLVLPWHYGLRGLHRIDSVFEANIHSMFSKTLPDLPPKGFEEKECGFVQMIARNPRYTGKGYASQLLQYQLEQHFAKHPDVPVILDTTTKDAIRAYERLGFKLLAEKPLDTGTDETGILLKGAVEDQTRQRIREHCVQRIMVKLP